jgi:hypothetical protein
MALKTSSGDWSTNIVVVKSCALMVNDLEINKVNLQSKNQMIKVRKRQMTGLFRTG